MKTALITALAAIGALTCACSSQGSPQPTVTVTTTVPAQAAAGGQAGGGQAGGGQGASVPAPCSTRYLGGTAGLAQGTAGSTYVVLVLKNLNNTPCSLYGYPGVSAGGGVPVHQIGLAATEDPATPRVLVTLAPHATASALLRIVHAANFPAAECHPVTAHWLVIYPPNQTVPIYLGYSTPACAGNVPLLTIDAVRPGSGGA